MNELIKQNQEFKTYKNNLKDSQFGDKTQKQTVQQIKKNHRKKKIRLLSKDQGRRTNIKWNIRIIIIQRKKQTVMNIQWETTKPSGLKHSNRWGHSSATLPNNLLVLYGGYAQSKFLKDVWLFNPSKNLWAQAKFTQNSLSPCQRSNSTFIYCENYNGILMFGGGSTQNTKLNDLWVLKITQNKDNNTFQGYWEELFPQNGKVPWGRTYHVSQIFNNFLIIQGGESYTGQIDDFWALNLDNLCWIELKNEYKQQARKFHSSAIVKQKLYIIGGIYGSYQPLNKIQYVDLKIFKSPDLQAIEDHRFQWKEVELLSPLSNMIGRWGHISKVYENNIYIFGGRTSVEQNDLLIFDPKKNQLQKVSAMKIPEGRRKPCSWLIGSVLIINSGYNGTYLSDQYWIDLRFTRQEHLNKKITAPQTTHKKQLCDIHINTSDNKYIDMYSKFIRNSFETEEDMIGMIEELAEMKHEIASKYVEILSNGVYLNKNAAQEVHEELIFSNKNIPEDNKFDCIDQRKLKKYKITFSTNQLLANKKKILFNVVKQNTVMNLNPFKLIRVARQEFNRIFREVQNDCCCDTKIVLKQETAQNDSNRAKKVLKCCRYPLIFRSEYFKKVIEGIERKTNAKRGDQIEVEIKVNQVDYKLMKIVILYCYYGHVIIPKDTTLVECISLFKLTKKLSLQTMMSISFGQIKELIFSKDMDDWINLKLNKKQKPVLSKKFNPEKGFQSNQSLGSSVFDSYEYISEQQFEDLICFCINQSKILSRKSSKSENANLPSNKWEQILLYLTSRVAELEFKRHTQELLRLKMESSKLSRRQSKIRNSMKRNGQNKENINKQNQDKKQNNLSQNILIQKEQCKQKKVKQTTDTKQKAIRWSHFELILSLVRKNLIQQNGKNKTSVQKELKQSNQCQQVKQKQKKITINEVERFFQMAVMKQKVQSEFKFKILNSELIK